LDSIHISDEQSTLSVPHEKSSDKLSDIEKQLTAGLSPLEIEEIQQTCKLVRKRH
jgi:DNA replication protein DnaD